MLRSIFTRQSAHRPAGAPAKRAAFVPRVEALESRLVPTITFHSDDTFSYVDGDYWGDDNLTLRAFGDGTYSVADAAGTTISVPAGKLLWVSTHWGNDTVRYIGGNFHGVVSSVIVDLGEGNDKFLGTFNRDIGDQADVVLRVFGHGGDDMIAVYGTEVAPSRRGDMITNGAAVNTNGLYIEEGSSLDIGIYGQGGNDTIFFDYDGQLDGLLDLDLDGDGGDDRVEANLNVRAGSTGDVGTVDELAIVNGGSGSDTLVFKVFDHSDGQAGIHARAQGKGRFDWFDHDTALVTRNVTVLGCDTVLA